MSTLRIEKQLADSSISLTKNTLASGEQLLFDISRMVTGLVTVNGTIRADKERKRKTKTRLDCTGFLEPYYASAGRHRRSSCAYSFSFSQRPASLLTAVEKFSSRPPVAGKILGRESKSSYSNHLVSCEPGIRLLTD